MFEAIALVLLKVITVITGVVLFFLAICGIFACIRSAQISREEERINREQGLDRWR